MLPLFFDLSIFGAEQHKKSKNANSRITCVYSKKMLKFRSTLMVLRKFFQGSCKNKICSKLLIEGMFATDFFVRALIVLIQWRRDLPPPQYV